LLIYRLENEEGEGCYARGFGFKCARQSLNDNDPQMKDLHPSPDGDDKLARFWAGFHLTVKEMRRWPDAGRRSWQCAFESLEQLEAWFPLEGLARMKMLAEKHNDSMMLVVLEVPHHKVRKGETQVIYHRDFAKVVERMSLDDLCLKLAA
jgi:hypothetical protein